MSEYRYTLEVYSDPEHKDLLVGLSARSMKDVREMAPALRARNLYPVTKINR